MARYTSAKSVPKVEAEPEAAPEPVVEKAQEPTEAQPSLDQVLDDFHNRLTAIEAALFRLRSI